MADLLAIDGLTIKDQNGTDVSSTGLSGDKKLTISGKANTGRFARQSTLLLSGTGVDETKIITIDQASNGMALTDESKNDNDLHVISQAETMRSIYISFKSNAQKLHVVAEQCSNGSYYQNDGQSTLPAYFIVDSGGSKTYPTSYGGITPSSATIIDKIEFGTSSVSFGSSATGIFDTSNWAEITGDPGASAAYYCRVSVNVPLSEASAPYYYVFALHGSGTDADGKAYDSVACRVKIQATASSIFLYVNESGYTNSDDDLVYELDPSTNSVTFYVNTNTSWSIKEQ